MCGCGVGILSSSCGDSITVKRSIGQSGFVENIRNKKNRVLGALAVLCALILGVGIYTEHYFVIFVFGVWLCAEALLLKLQPLLRWSFRKTSVDAPTSDQEILWRLFHEADENSEVIGGIKLSHWLGTHPTDVQKRWALQFRLLSQLKIIFDCKKDLPGIRKIQQRLLFRKKGNFRSIEDEKGTLEIKSVQTVIEAAVLVSDLIARVQVIAQNEDNRMGEEAKALIAQILGGHFEAPRSGILIDQLCDVMQSDSGVPFLILNLLHEERFYEAREFATAILANEIFVEEDLRSTLYWLAEVEWFSREKKKELLDHDNAIRYLYHLCFMSPDRAGFLEIDSQFFSELAPVNELAEEGFVFKETLVESFLELWKNYEGWFDGIFQNSLESLTGRKSKIYDERDNWERFWLQEQANFSRQYLYVIEGNLSYAEGHFSDAAHCYKKALALVPDLRAALFNLLFASAKLKDSVTHAWAKNKILEVPEWLPLSLSSIGNSLLLLGDDRGAEETYELLKNEKGWERKTDFYISTFSFEQGWYDKALLFAIKAHAVNPVDSTISFHLSRCYSAVGEKEAALNAFKLAQGGSGQAQFNSQGWLSFYQFTLERDSGRCEEAGETLLKIPKDYFQDAEELKAAVDFARGKKDLVLLRHLKQ